MLRFPKKQFWRECRNGSTLINPGCIAFVILFVLTAAWGNKYFWAGLPAAGMGVLYLIYFFVIERVVYRTEFGIFLCMFLCLCFFWGKNPEGRKGHNVEITRICAIITLVCVIMQSVLYIPDRSYLDVTEESRKDYIEETFFESWNYDARKYRKVVNKNVPANGLIEEIEANRQNFYFLDFQTTMQTLYYEWNPFYTLPEEYFQNSLYFASIMTNYPECIEILSGYHAEQPLKALANENVYLVDLGIPVPYSGKSLISRSIIIQMQELNSIKKLTDIRYGKFIQNRKRRRKLKMISFNVPPVVGNEMKYIKEAIENKKICGDGVFTKKCSAWLEQKTGTAKAFADYFLHTCHRDGSDPCGHPAGRRGDHAFLYLCLYGRCLCTAGSKGGFCRYPSGYDEYR